MLKATAPAIDIVAEVFGDGLGPLLGQAAIVLGTADPIGVAGHDDGGMGMLRVHVHYRANPFRRHRQQERLVRLEQHPGEAKPQ